MCFYWMYIFVCVCVWEEGKTGTYQTTNYTIIYFICNAIINIFKVSKFYISCSQKVYDKLYCYIALQWDSQLFVTLLIHLVSMETYYIAKLLNQYSYHRSYIKCYYYTNASNKCNQTQKCRKLIEMLTHENNIFPIKTKIKYMYITRTDK